MLKKNLMVLAAVLAVCAAVLFIGLRMNQGGFPLQPPANTADGAPDAGDAALYLVASVDGVEQEPIALQSQQDYTFEQENGAINTVHVTQHSIVMSHSNCKNQDCVKQGEVTLSNRETRFLGNMIICLPNRVTLELCTADELSRRVTIQ